MSCYSDQWHFRKCQKCGEYLNLETVCDECQKEEDLRVEAEFPLLLSGYIHCGQIPNDIIRSIRPFMESIKVRPDSIERLYQMIGSCLEAYKSEISHIAHIVNIRRDLIKIEQMEAFNKIIVSLSYDLKWVLGCHATGGHSQWVQVNTNRNIMTLLDIKDAKYEIRGHHTERNLVHNCYFYCEESQIPELAEHCQKDQDQMEQKRLQLIQDRNNRYEENTECKCIAL